MSYRTEGQQFCFMIETHVFRQLLDGTMGMDKQYGKLLRAIQEVRKQDFRQALRLNSELPIPKPVTDDARLSELDRCLSEYHVKRQELVESRRFFGGRKKIKRELESYKYKVQEQVRFLKWSEELIVFFDEPISEIQVD